MSLTRENYQSTIALSLDFFLTVRLMRNAQHFHKNRLFRAKMLLKENLWETHQGLP